ncbi:hypothetical protein F0562_027931 [Nyssa sinensis]|uniref:Uncharacterized protein n=1 Tax=Nyssa sinensis TaxID=561372 RepID=A0A5J5B7C0_9ASTE|nr:hypothetical protein F0562_027931 [Nyssa sinensis]
MEVGTRSLNLRFAHCSDFNFFFLHHSSVSSKFHMGCIQHCHRSRHLTISVLFLLISSLTHVRFTAEGREMYKLVDQASQKGREEKVVVVRSVIGSRPPRCERRFSIPFILIRFVGCGHTGKIRFPSFGRELIMLKQSPSRNQRSKGFKAKHALQICLLLAIATWLLYQVKQSYYKVALEESSGKIPEKEHGHEILKLGRKDLNPRVEEATAENLKHGAEEEMELEDEERKPKEDEDEGREVGDDDIDGQDQDIPEEEEPEQLEDLTDEEDKESEVGSEGIENFEEEYNDDGASLNNHGHKWNITNRMMQQLL